MGKIKYYNLHTPINKGIIYTYKILYKTMFGFLTLFFLLIKNQLQLMSFDLEGLRHYKLLNQLSIFFPLHSMYYTFANVIKTAFLSCLSYILIHKF